MFRKRFAPTSSIDFEQKKRGRDNELRLLVALRDPLAELPGWIIGVRAANHTEDYKEHTDVFVETRDAGDIRIQVKSSYRYAKRFKSEYPHLADKIIVVVINQGMTLSKIRGRVLPLIGNRRNKLILERRYVAKEEERTEREYLQEIIGVVQFAQHPRWITSFHLLSREVDGIPRWNFSLTIRQAKEVRLQVVIGKENLRKILSEAPQCAQNVIVVAAKLGDDRKRLCDRIYCELGSALNIKKKA